MKSLALFLALCLSTSAVATPALYIRSNGQFVANGNEYARGFWVPAVQNAGDVFAGNPLALEEYRDHVTDAKWFSILNWGALGAYLTYVAISSSNDNYNGGLGLLIFVIPWGGGLFMGARSNRHLVKAMNLVNGVTPDQARFQPAKTLEIPLLSYSF